uniref:MHC class I-like antigen recognition-like domain-containing protein n=2 Tax=Papio anubis TaxID=9555 RepID=A0A8I5NED7_PAPAN
MVGGCPARPASPRPGVSAPQRVCPETLRKKAVTSGLSILETAEGQTSPAGTRPALSCSRVKNLGSAHTHAVEHFFTIPVRVFVSMPNVLPVTLHNVPRMPLTCSPVRLLLLLLLLLTALEIMVGAHSLCFNFTIKSWSRPGQPWCEAQVFMNKNLFLQYNSDSNMVKPLGLLGKKVNATSTWGELTQTLGEVGRDLRMLLLDIKPQIKTSGPSTLQVKMFCQHEVERCTGASWQFAINGEKSLLLDAMNMTWTVINHEACKIKETWKNDRGLEKYFRKLSMGDCNHWLREFSGHWEVMPEPTDIRSSTMNPSEMQRKVPPRRQKTRNRASSTRQVNKMVISEEQMKLPSTKEVEPPTWGQLKELTQLAEKSLKKTRVTHTPENMLLAALMIVSTVSASVSSSSEETATSENGP